ncbi:hypothetical protein PILCRDRAFT_85536 [Piloderma croceum F 1598]|uniref:Uncharacterized protein n=1 Tax=Piloderma croceum (strain F 1598) TaxID=765440 RepID=A0A0C3CF22_PILCF|nr:hypothetical protein PILCRDRAFT_85536 [Piloderma croceum F 1598]
MPSVFSKFQLGRVATVDQESNSKPRAPYMCPGNPDLQTCIDWERDCRRYANNKDIPVDTIDFQVVVQSMNALLNGTPHYLDKDRLQERIEARMNQVLNVQVMNTKLHEVKDFWKWLTGVKSLDNEKCFETNQAVKAFEKSVAVSHAASHKTQNNNVLSGPSCKANAIPAAPTANNNYPPKLTNEEKNLLLRNNGCLKCHKPFMFHKDSDKAPGCPFPVGTGYRTPTQAAVTPARPPNYNPSVASIIAADSSFHPVTVVFPGIANPVDYLAANMSSIIGGDNPDSSLSSSPLMLQHFRCWGHLMMWWP